VILVDGHVHLHDCFGLPQFLSGTYENFRTAARRSWPGRVCTCVMIVTDASEQAGYERLTRLDPVDDCPSPETGDGWRVQATDENTSLLLGRASDEEMIAISGRQIRSAENLEVLAVGTRARFEDGLPMERLIRMVSEEGALPVIPWGFGKWAASRRRLLSRLLRDANLPTFFLGDNGNRPRILHRSRLFKVAEGLGIRDLPGSDPLPFRGDSGRAGSSGAVFEGRLDRKTPARHLLSLLLDPQERIWQYATQRPLLQFVRYQSAMQFRKLSS